MSVSVRVCVCVSRLSLAIKVTNSCTEFTNDSAMSFCCPLPCHSNVCDEAHTHTLCLCAIVASCWGGKQKKIYLLRRMECVLHSRFDCCVCAWVCGLINNDSDDDERRRRRIHFTCTPGAGPVQAYESNRMPNLATNFFRSFSIIPARTHGFCLFFCICAHIMRT